MYEPDQAFFKRSIQISPVCCSISYRVRYRGGGGEGEGEGRETNFKVHIRMADLRHEGHHGWRMRVVIGDFDVDFPAPALVGGSFDAFENCDEVCDVVFGDGLETVETGVGVFVVVGELFHEASADGRDCGGGHGGCLV